MSNPSLLCVPYRFKTSKLYSQIPDSGLGDFTVTRSASNSATRVNAAGFIETVADNVPRLDYPLGGITAGCPALLVEPSAQNLALQSSDFTTWNAQNSATANPNTAISPDGTLNADTINLAAVTDSRINQVITVANSTTYTISCFYKNIALTTGQTFNMVFNNSTTPPNNFFATAVIDLAAGTASYAIAGTAGTGYSGTATGRIENYGNGWYRVSLTFTVGTAGGTAGGFRIAQVTSATARSFYAWGAQLEANSVPTSYIPTAASPVTRGAETITDTTATALIGQTEGAVYMELVASNFGTEKMLFQIDNGTATQRVAAFYSSSGNITFATANSSQYLLSTGANLSLGVHKVALSYSNNNLTAYVNGSLYASGTPTHFPIAALNQITLGARINAGVYGIFLNDRIRAIELYTTRLPNTGPLSLQSLTQ